ncbi:MAG: hypothetical protein WBM40_15765 [Thiohalocapsa sp.]
MDESSARRRSKLAAAERDIARLFAGDNFKPAVWRQNDVGGNNLPTVAARSSSPMWLGTRYGGRGILMHAARGLASAIPRKSIIVAPRTNARFGSIATICIQSAERLVSTG